MIKLEKLSAPELGYRLDVEVPQEDVDKAYQKRLADVASNVELKGFRKGRVPDHVVESKFGKGICQEVASEVIQLSFQNALTENALAVAGQPKFDTHELIKGKPYHYSATFEVYPSIELVKLDGVEVHKDQAKVSSADIDQMLEKMQKDKAEWQATDAVASDGFQVNINFEGFLQDKAFEGGSAENFNLVLGSGQFIAGFEEALVGAKAGDEKELPLTFPDNYPVQDLTGKDVVFKVKINTVESPILPALDDDFASQAGFDGGLEALKQDISNNMQRELDERLKNRFKLAVLDVLLAKNPLVIPNALVDIEIEHMQKMSVQQMAAQQGKKELSDINLPRDPFVEEATKRVKLGLLLAEVIKLFDIKLDSALVRQRIEEMAASYKEKDQVISWYYNNKNMMAEVEASVLEDQAIDFLLQSATISERQVSYEEIMKENQQG